MATRTISAAGGNFNAVGTWDEGIVPTSADDVVCRGDGTSGQLTVNVASSCKSINFTNYSNTLTMNNTLTIGTASAVGANVTLVAAMTIAGASGLIPNNGVTGTFTSNGKTWGRPLTFGSGTITITFADDWQITDCIRQGISSNVIVLNGSTLNISGNFTTGNNSASSFGGTTNIVLNGTGTWTGGTLVPVTNNVTINTAGTITFSANVAYATNTLTYTAGTVDTTTNNNVLTLSSCTLNTNGITFRSIAFSGAVTITLNSALQATTINIDANITFAGASGFTVGTLNIGVTANTGRTLTLKDGVTYNINTALNSTASTNSSRAVITSSHAANTTALVLGSNVVQNNGYLNGTRVNSSGGLAVWTFNGILTTTTNWNTFTSPRTVAYTFCSRNFS